MAGTSVVLAGAPGLLTFYDVRDVKRCPGHMADGINSVFAKKYITIKRPKGS